MLIKLFFIQLYSAGQVLLNFNVQTGQKVLGHINTLFLQASKKVLFIFNCFTNLNDLLSQPMLTNRPFLKFFLDLLNQEYLLQFEQV